MKKISTILAIAAAVFAAVSCEQKEEKASPVDVTVKLMYDGTALAVSGAPVTLTDASGSITYEQKTNAAGAAVFSLMPGIYSASATYKTVEDGKRIAYNGANTTVSVAGTPVEFELSLNKAVSQQIIIKELYTTGCPKNDNTGSYTSDAYVILYNNSEFEADASDIQFTFLAPYNAHGTNKYMQTDGTLLYEKDTWLPAYGAIWWFTSDNVKIPAYSQIVVAFFGAIDHTASYNYSVNLANPEYYVMSNANVSQYTNAKYAVSDVIPTSHYLTCVPFTQGTAWAISSICPGFYIGKGSKADAEAMSKDSEKYDTTLGTTAAMRVVKYPQANVIDAVEVYSAANKDKSNPRFPQSINTGAVLITNQKGYSVYRNVDKEATEALAENAGKLVYGYTGGTDDATGSTDPSGIDAEASIAAGAHIIYSDTNSSDKDFHQRKTASLRK